MQQYNEKTVFSNEICYFFIFPFLISASLKIARSIFIFLIGIYSYAQHKQNKKNLLVETNNYIQKVKYISKPNLRVNSYKRLRTEVLSKYQHNCTGNILLFSASEGFTSTFKRLRCLSNTKLFTLSLLLMSLLWLSV